MISNPFQIKTPEMLDSQETVDLFVDVFTDYQKIRTEGHTIILGPRGIGKSMILRYMQPDCQCLTKNGNVDQVEYLGFYIPFKKASFTTVTELRRLEKNGAQILNEHIMSVYVLQMVYNALSNINLYGENHEQWDIEARSYYQRICDEYLPAGDYPDCKDISISEIFLKLKGLMSRNYREAIAYTKKLSFTKEVLPYNGLLFDYLEYTLPMICLLRTISCFAGKQIYLLMDDAHCLTMLQTHILNFWVFSRTSGEIGIKISTQYNYKSYYTITGSTIDAPHDYSEIDMMKVYTSDTKVSYKRRITEIVNKRLRYVGISKTPEEFFPVNPEQEDAIKVIAEEYNSRYDRGEGRGNKRTDDSVRYARPDYIKSLLGKSKNGYTYSYSGFDQLVHLSSGITRAFLENAYKMYAEEMIAKPDVQIDQISASTQNKIAREDANAFLFNELPKYVEDDAKSNDGKQVYPEEDIHKLFNVINGLGGLFREILVSERSERRVFSIAISDIPSKEVRDILSLGVQLGYFHKSTIGKKDGMAGGRTNLYILNRRLSPIWTLDPTSFAGYLFVQNRLLEDAMKNPNALLRRTGKILSEEEDKENGFVQLSFFPKDDESLFSLETGDKNV